MWRLLLVVLLVATLGTIPASGDGPTPNSNPGLELEWAGPSLSVQVSDQETVEVTARGYAQLQKPGWAQVPFTSTLIALPAGARPQMEVLETEEVTRSLPGTIASAPFPRGVRRDEQGHPIGGTFSTDHTAAPLTPSAPITVETIGLVRGIQLARVTFYPALPEGGELHLTRRASARITWQPPDRDSPMTGQPMGQTRGQLTDPLLQSLRRAVVNPSDVAPVRPASVQSAPPAAEGVFIEVDQPGLYQITRDDLAALALADVAPRHLRLFQGNAEVAYAWDEAEEALHFYAEPRFSRWTEVDAYRLVADDDPGIEINTRSANPGELPAGKPLVKQVFEENHHYTPDCFCGQLPSGRDGDRWVWADLRRPGQASATFPFTLPAVDTSHPADLTLWLIGYTNVEPNPDHLIEVTLNGQTLGRVAWEGKAAVTKTLTIPAGRLQGEGNALSLVLPGLDEVNVEGAWLDAFAVRYVRSTAPAGASVHFGVRPDLSDALTVTPLPHQVYLPLVTRHVRRAGAASRYSVSLDAPGPYHAYDVTDPLKPQRLTDVPVVGTTLTVSDPPGEGARRYLITDESGIQRPVRMRRARDPFDLDHTASPGASDYLIITHPAFADALRPLVALRRSQGLSTMVVNVLGLYDAYGDGRPEPEAIRAFIADAYASWNPRPTYVLLVGDGSFDPRRYRSDSPATFIPPYLADVDPWAGETAADNRYACVDGDDSLPDLLLGRLPVQTTEQAANLVDKIVKYESTPYPGGWNADVLLVADDADGAGDFAAFSEGYTAIHVGDAFTITRRYCAGHSPTVSDCAPAETKAIRSALEDDLDQGAFLVQFAGHASWQQWASERFLHLDDLPALSNARRLPVLVEMTCFTGAFHRPAPTLDEELVRISSGGTAAAWGPTGLGVGTGHASLSQGFARALLVDQVTRIGEATLAGKLALAKKDHHLDLLDTFVLLGDPALSPPRQIIPWSHRIYLPLVLSSPRLTPNP